ncbi:MAG: molybdopterin-synthase adenylyltransferase MoeB [Phaeospirillum sp.]|nr:molybdopterin-synthase adenylyltransferase MoeB [Phaeospirillum sp.]
MTTSTRRYIRQVILPELWPLGQEKLGAAKVLIVGAGGLGSPAALYLAAAGVGTVGLVDFDVVDLSNLQRQILHTTQRVGEAKTESARKTLTELNPEIKIETHNIKLTQDNAQSLFKNCDVIVDGSDNFATRYIINDTCVRLKKPFVHGSVLRFEGQVSVFWPGRGPCYRCLYSTPPPPEDSPSCAEAGVLGVLPGIIGTLQATETIKIILEKGDLLLGRLLCCDALKMNFKEIKFSYDTDCLCSKNRQTI